MHGPPLTLDEMAALIHRQYTDLRDLGANFDLALKAVAERHHVPASTVGQLLVWHRGLENRRARQLKAAA